MSDEGFKAMIKKGTNGTHSARSRLNYIGRQMAEGASLHDMRAELQLALYDIVDAIQGADADGAWRQLFDARREAIETGDGAKAT